MKIDPSAGTDLCDRLCVVLTRAYPTWRDAPLVPLPDSGLAHSHIRLAGLGLIARLPKQSQMNLGAHDNLAHQAACFERAAPSGHTPRLHAVLAPCAELPRGGLIVDDIVGRPAALPGDLPAIAQALASIHRLPLPAVAERAPLTDDADPLAALLAEIDAQALHLGEARLAPSVASAIEVERQRLCRLVELPSRPPPCLISFDAHPGNFIVDARGRAVLVDLEKCRYSHGALDLAHATLYTSTTWDVASHAVLDVDQVLQAGEIWCRALSTVDESSRSWWLPLRRAMWLWSITWCAKWRVVSGAEAGLPDAIAPSADGEDWSARRSTTALIAHVRDRVDHYLSPQGIERVQDEFEVLSRRLPSHDLTRPRPMNRENRDRR